MNSIELKPDNIATKTTLPPNNFATMDTITLKVSPSVHAKYETWKQNKTPSDQKTIDCSFTQLIQENSKMQKQLDAIAARKEKKKQASNNNWPSLPAELQVPVEVSLIASLAVEIRKRFICGGKEHHFQAALERELQVKGYFPQQEVARLIHYKTLGGTTIQLPHDIRGREDILLDNEKMVLELKQTKKLTKQEHQQLYRYMEDRRMHSPWGNETKGMLINFGDDDIEVWFSCYNGSGRLQRIFILKEEMEDFDLFMDTYKK